MNIAGLQKTTLLDFPGRVAATFFLGGCNFACPFCQNAQLLDTAIHYCTVDELLQFLKKRQGILEGVCISGGEPTLSSELPDLIRDIRSLGYAIKLDTNGSNPDLLATLLAQHQLDMVAMDIKNTLEKYPQTCGISASAFDTAAIEASVKLLLKTDGSPSFSYEFRTTVVRELHTIEDIEKISHWISGAKAYALQPFEDSDAVPFSGLHAPDANTMASFLAICKTNIPNTFLRGV